MLEVLNENNFDEHIKDGLKLVMFGSDICQYCVKEQKVLEELAEGDINIGKIDAYKAPKLAQKYSITSFPTFILFKAGDILAQFSGFRTKSELLDTVLKYV
ncbi:MAG: thioredoxin family protein [Candidatus Gastranaerophilales bacterium]|nr:thioredoxin family protein [Candidatus Gastranaerophilales bacterium]